MWEIICKKGHINNKAYSKLDLERVRVHFFCGTELTQSRLTRNYLVEFMNSIRSISYLEACCNRMLWVHTLMGQAGQSVGDDVTFIQLDDNLVVQLGVEEASRHATVAQDGPCTSQRKLKHHNP